MQLSFRKDGEKWGKPSGVQVAYVFYLLSLLLCVSFKILPFSAHWSHAPQFTMEYGLSLLVYWSSHRERHFSLNSGFLGKGLGPGLGQMYLCVFLKIFVYLCVTHPWSGLAGKVTEWLRGPNHWVCMCPDELSASYTKCPLHSSRSIVRAIPLLD